MENRTVLLTKEALEDFEKRSHARPKLGKPRLQKTPSSLQDFYEALVLLSILEPTQGAQPLELDIEPGANVHLQSWHKFLDQLSWLCDNTPGGDSVSSVAVEAELLGPKYWLGVNKSPAKGFQHLKYTLGQLATLKGSSQDAVVTIHDDLLKRSITFSSDKVKNYGYLLCRAVKNLNDEEGAARDLHELDLLQSLEPIQELKAHHLELCHYAFQWSHWDVLNEVCKVNFDPERRSEWSRIRHCIGRLGSWARSVRLLVHYAQNHPEVVENFEVGFIPAPRPMPLPDEDHRTVLEFVLRRVLRDKDDAYAKELLEVARTTRGSDIDSRFLKKYKSPEFEPRTHSEVLVHEHFRLKKLSFFSNDRYIGCSKPSCYSCNLYFQFHPSKITTRESHGNIWYKWCIPPSAMEIDNRLGWDTKGILKKMTTRLHEDILRQLESGERRRPRVPDSTTGMWTVPSLMGLAFRAGND